MLLVRPTIGGGRRRLILKSMQLRYVSYLEGGGDISYLDGVGYISYLDGVGNDNIWPERVMTQMQQGWAMCR